VSIDEDIPAVWIVQNNAKLGLVHELQRFALGNKSVSRTFNKCNMGQLYYIRGIKWHIP
jgi:thiamine pyrophosphate-dependent acetolactate synthase large subunit-like protein